MEWAGAVMGPACFVYGGGGEGLRADALSTEREGEDMRGTGLKNRAVRNWLPVTGKKEGLLKVGDRAAGE